MRLVDAETGIEVIDRHECLELLGTTDVGRIAVVDAGHPMIFPVNYGLDGDLIVVRTAPGTKLDVALRGGPVAFEIDSTDRVTRTGWSVIVTGWARAVTEPAALERLGQIGLRSWTEHKKDRWIAVHPERVSGRRIVNLDT